MLSQLSFFNRQRRKELTSNSSKCVTSSNINNTPSSSSSSPLPVNQLSSPSKSDSSEKKEPGNQFSTNVRTETNNDQIEVTTIKTVPTSTSATDQSTPSSVTTTTSTTITGTSTTNSTATKSSSPPPTTTAIQSVSVPSTVVDNHDSIGNKVGKESPSQQLNVEQTTEARSNVTKDVLTGDNSNISPPSYSSNITVETINRQQPHQQSKPGSSFIKLTFRCQLAHGSATQMISGFSNMKELYEKIASTFNLSTDQILYCTLNTPKVDMDQLLGGQIGLEDFIFAHCKGQPKEVELTKNEELLGLTITDNGTGYSFIKKIKSGSLVDSIKYISVGDVIEKIEGKCFIGCRHFEVAKALKDLPIGHTFTLRLIEPSRGGFGSVGPRPVSTNHSPNKLGSGRETLRLRATGSPISSNHNAINSPVIDKINVLLESFMGIHDNELATQIWEIGSAHANPHDFVMAIDGSDLQIFGFNEDLLFDLWGVINDSKTGRNNQSKVNGSS